MTWRVSTREKKSVVQIDTWEKDDMTMQREIGWRWGHFLYDEKPNVVGLGIDWENNQNEHFSRHSYNCIQNSFRLQISLVISDAVFLK